MASFPVPRFRLSVSLPIAVAVGIFLAFWTAPATASTDYRQVVDMTFPAVQGARFSDDYMNGRSGGRTHRATDLFAASGTPVYAAVGGTIGWMPTSPHATAGYAIQVRGTDGRTYGYYHLGPARGPRSAAYASGLSVGSRVQRGQLIGYLGDSGNAAGGSPHLHFEINDTRVRDPLGTNRINPVFSLRSAVQRGDYGSRVSTPPASRSAPAASPSAPATSASAVLRLGSRGSAVGEWQRQLNQATAARLATDGVFGPATDRSTRAFQRQHRLTVDGIVGAQSRRAMSAALQGTSAASTPSAPRPASAPSATASSSSSLLRLGSRGNAVRTWQQQLSQVGPRIGTDGVFGPQTLDATRRFQRGQGIAADGVVGPQSRQAMERALR